jgi:sodium/potassium/calcium exchanger 6
MMQNRSVISTLILFLAVSCFIIVTNGDDEVECDYDDIILYEDKCAYVQNCTEDSKIRYYYLYYCSLSNAVWFSYVLFLFLLIIYFYLLGQVADRFFVPTLSEISIRLKLPASVSSVTLMAFGNGAPDIFSTFASVQAGEYQQAFGQVVGATAFISLCITGFLSIGGWVIGYQVYRRPFLKDVGILAMAVCLVFFVVHDFKIEPWEPYFCLILYLGFILLTVIARIIFQRQKNQTSCKGNQY